MLDLYLFCLIVGGGLLLFSILAGGHGDSGEADASTDAAVHADLHPADFHTDVHDVHAANGDNTGSADSVKFISLRNLIYFMAFFGLTGTIFNKFFDYPGWIDLLFAVFVGGIAAFFGFKLMRYLKRTETGEAVDIYQLIGKTATVSLPISKENRGKVYLTVKDGTTEVIAEMDPDSSVDVFKTREEVFITSVENGIVHVSDKFI